MSHVSLAVDRNLRLHARNIPDKTAATDGRRSLTYRQLDQRINRIANGLSGIGLAKGDRVAVLLRNRLEWIEILFACARSGVVCVPVNGRFVGREIAYVLQHSGSRALITESSLAGGIESIRPELSEIRGGRWILLDETAAGWHAYEGWLSQASDQHAAGQAGDDDCWYFGYTSGTTGQPKATIISHRIRTLGACYAGIEYNLGDADTTLIVMPMFHSNGIFFQMMQLMLGGTVFVMQDFDPELILRHFEQARITNVSLVPTMYAMILALPEATRNRYRMDSLRVAQSSSAPLLAKTKEEMLAFFKGVQLHEFYGSTEAGFVTNLKPRDQFRKQKSVGQSFFGTEVKLLDEDGREVATGEVGELWSRGVTHAQDGYFGDPAATEAAFKEDGWFSAGDMARCDDEGYYYIVDRKKDLIISGGENIFPTEVENVLIRHPAIAEVAVIALPDEVWGDRVCAVARLHPGAALTLEALRQWSDGRIAGYKKPRELRIVDELIKSPTGKLLRRQIRERLDDLSR